MHSFEVRSNESTCRKKVRLGLEQVSPRFGFNETSNMFEDIHLVWFGPVLVRYVPPDYKERLEHPLQTHPHDPASHTAPVQLPIDHLRREQHHHPPQWSR